MAHIQDRGKEHARRWQARYRDENGREKSRTFERKLDARRWLDAKTAEMVRGDYIDPNAGRVRFRPFAEQWLASQTFAESTRETTETRLRGHIYPTFGERELRNIRPSDIQAWLRAKQDTLAPSYVRVLLANLSAILAAAVADDLIRSNPCTSRVVNAPALPDVAVKPWTHAAVESVIAAHPAQYRAMPIVGAGCGLRQGEILGLRTQDVDFLGRTLHVRQQLKIVRSQIVADLPKRGRVREVPLPETVAYALSERLRSHGPGPDDLIFWSREGKPMNRNYVNVAIWKPAVAAAGLKSSRSNGMHALRHYFASVLLEAGVSIRALADYLGHKDPAFTLRVYAHMMPEAAGKARAAIDGAFAGARAASDGMAAES